MFEWLRNLLFGKKREKEGRCEMGDVRTDMAQQTVQTAPVTMYAKAEKDGDGVKWSLGESNPPAPGKAIIRVPLGESRRIMIHLVATQGLDIKFDTSDPIWAHEGKTCPPPQGISTGGQLELVNCTDRLLTLSDTAERDSTIMYQMNFIGAEPFDPEIRNGSGGLADR